MQPNTIKQKLHEFIDRIDAQKAAAMYTLFENEIELGSLPYSEQFKAILDQRVAAYYKTGNTVSSEEMNQRIASSKTKRA